MQRRPRLQIHAVRLPDDGRVRAVRDVRERVGPQLLDQLDGPREERVRRVAGGEVLGPDADDDVPAGVHLPRRVADDAAVPERHLACPGALPRQEVHRRRADEPGDEPRGRVLVDLHRRADLLGAPGVHHDHPVRERHRLDLVVRHVEARGAELPVQLLDLEAHLHAELRVEVRQRLVEQEHLRLADDRAAHRDALALAARELAGLALEQRTELEDAGRALHAGLDVGLRHAADLEPVGHVVVHAHVRVERVVLEHHRDVPVLGLERVDDRVADGDLAGGDRLEPRDHAQQRRLAAARGADDDDELAVGDLRVDAVDHLELRVALADVSEFDFRHRYFSVSTSPLTNHFCIRMTISAGGSIASIAVAITRCHSVAASPPPAIIRLMPIAIV